MLRIAAHSIVDVNDKKQLEDYILQTLSQLHFWSHSSEIISELLEKFRKTPPNNPDTLKELFGLALSLSGSGKIYCLIRFLSLSPEKKLEVKKMVLDIAQDKNSSQDRLSILDSFIKYLVNKDQLSKDDLLELLFVIKGSFSVKEQIFLYKKLFPFLSSEQIEMVSKGVIGQVDKTMPYNEYYLALLTILENLSVSGLETEEMPYKALTLLKLISTSSQKQQTDNNIKITFEEKAKLINFLAKNI